MNKPWLISSNSYNVKCVSVFIELTDLHIVTDERMLIFWNCDFILFLCNRAINFDITIILNSMSLL